MIIEAEKLSSKWNSLQVCMHFKGHLATTGCREWMWWRLLSWFFFCPHTHSSRWGSSSSYNEVFTIHNKNLFCVGLEQSGSVQDDCKNGNHLQTENQSPNAATLEDEGASSFSSNRRKKTRNHWGQGQSKRGISVRGGGMTQPEDCRLMQIEGTPYWNSFTFLKLICDMSQTLPLRLGSFKLWRLIASRLVCLKWFAYIILIRSPFVLVYHCAPYCFPRLLCAWRLRTLRLAKTKVRLGQACSLPRASVAAILSWCCFISLCLFGFD